VIADSSVDHGGHIGDLAGEAISHDHIDLVGFHAADLPLACLYRDNRRHQFLLWIPNRLQE
jgi:hypothetical protein